MTIGLSFAGRACAIALIGSLLVAAAPTGVAPEGSVCQLDGPYYSCCYYDSEGELEYCEHWYYECTGWGWWQECEWVPA